MNLFYNTLEKTSLDRKRCIYIFLVLKHAALKYFLLMQPCKKAAQNELNFFLPISWSISIMQ